MPMRPGSCAGGRATPAVAAVCVWPAYVAHCVDALAGTDIRVATVVNFPSGEEPVDDVLAATRLALDDGADEIDVVLPYRSWLRGDEEAATGVLSGVRDLVNERVDHSAGPGLVKVIIESGELPDQAAIDRATHFAISLGADFVKTSTGKTPVSATPEAAEIILEAIELSGLTGRLQGIGRDPHGRPTPASTSSSPSRSWEMDGSLPIRSASVPVPCSTTSSPRPATS